MELRFDSSAGATFSDAKCDSLAARGFALLIEVPLAGIVSFSGSKSEAAALSRATTFRIG
jgi:hypothetical protein